MDNKGGLFMFLGMERGTQSTQGEGKIHFLGVENIFFGRQHMDPLKPCSELRRLAEQRIEAATDAVGWVNFRFTSPNFPSS